MRVCHHVTTIYKCKPGSCKSCEGSKEKHVHKLGDNCFAIFNIDSAITISAYAGSLVRSHAVITHPRIHCLDKYTHKTANQTRNHFLKTLKPSGRAFSTTAHTAQMPNDFYRLVTAI